MYSIGTPKMGCIIFKIAIQTDHHDIPNFRLESNNALTSVAKKKLQEVIAYNFGNFLINPQ